MSIIFLICVEGVFCGYMLHFCQNLLCFLSGLWIDGFCFTFVCEFKNFALIFISFVIAFTANSFAAVSLTCGVVLCVSLQLLSLVGVLKWF